MYFIFKIKTVNDKISVRPLAMVIGKELIKIPYTNHKKTPIVNIKIHPKETSLVCFVFQALTAWGAKAIVVNAPAENPIISMYVI